MKEFFTSVRVWAVLLLWGLWTLVSASVGACPGLAASSASPLTALSELMDLPGLSGAGEREVWWRIPDSVDYSVMVVGLAKGAEGRKIRWKTDADPFSGAYQELDGTVVDSNGRFVLATADISSTRLTYFEIDYYSTSLFVEPGKAYRLEFADFDYEADERMNAFVVSDQFPALTYRVVDAQGKPDTTDLNYRLARYSALYQARLARDFTRIQQRKDTVPVADFIRMSDSLFGYVQDTFFQAYRFYMEAGLKALPGVYSRRALYRQCIEGRSVDMENPAQMDFLDSYFKDYFQSSPFLPFDQLRRIVNRNDLSPASRLSLLSDSIGLDYALRGEYLHDWVMVHALAEGLDNERLNGNHIQAILRAYQTRSKFPDLSRAIDNLLAERAKRARRQYFAGVELVDMDGKEIPVDSLLGPGLFHYFVFVRADYANCPSCNEEGTLLKDIWASLPDNVKNAVRIVFVNCDYDFGKYRRDAKTKEYPWPYLHFNRNIEWVRTIDAAHFPAYILVDDQGHVLNSAFNAPSQNIGDVFRRMATLKALQDRRNTGL